MVTRSIRSVMSFLLTFVSACTALMLFSTTALSQEGGAMPDYEIGPEDVLEISVWREPELQREVIVRPDGGLSFPLVGDIRAAGKTPAQLEQEIAERLNAFIPDAVVSVSVLQLRGLRIYVNGKVRSPGQFEVGRYVDVVQAITLAGGFTPFADTRNIRVIRRGHDGTEQVFKVNYNDIERGRDMKQNIMLRSDDMVLVP